MLYLLDYFFLIFHSALVLFNLFGWAVKRLRMLNLVTLLLTGASWIILGFFYGFGYCPFTDFHWKVLKQLGVTNLPDSYIQYLFHRLFSISISTDLADFLTVSGLVVSLVISIILNVKEKRRNLSNL